MKQTLKNVKSMLKLDLLPNGLLSPNYCFVPHLFSNTRNFCKTMTTPKIITVSRYNKTGIEIIIQWSVLFFILSLLISCTENKDIKKYRQLRKDVLSHYKTDNNPLKEKAARFLLDNLRDRYAVEGERYNIYSDTIKRYYIERADTLIKKINLFKGKTYSSSVAKDIDLLTAEYLIDNIDRAFASLDRAGWKQDVDFADFCEYILPYRVGNEPLENWRKDILQDERLHICDTLFSFAELKEAATWLTRKQHKFKKRFRLMYGDNSANFPDLQYSILNLLPTGNCANLTQLSLFACRAAAIPIANDFTPHYGNFANGHDWVAVLTKDGIIPFILPIYNDTLGIFAGADQIASKVYRRTFSENKESHLKTRGFCDFLPAVFNNSRLVDVTQLYHATYDINVPVIFNKCNEEFVYLAVANRENWVPVGWGNQKNKMGNYTKAVVNCVYLPVFVSEVGKRHFNYPFILTEKGDISYLKPDYANLQRVELLRKHPIKFEIVRYINKMIGGKFQVAGNKDFKHATTLYTIKESPGVYYNDVELNLPNKYRFIRYLGEKSSYCHVAEIEFYERYNPNPLRGKIIGTIGYLPIENVFDGDVLTYFHTSQGDSAYVGMDLGESKDISKIRFVSRNDKNHIIPGNLYELFYWDHEWKSLGQQVATDKVLVYDQVPSKCLFLLKNYTEGKEERIFTYENGKQVWR